MVQYTRVDIDPFGKFERTCPLALESHIPQHQWESFANDVDQIVLKCNKDSKLFQVLLLVGPLLGMALFATGGFLSVRAGGFNPLTIFGVIIFMGCPIFSLMMISKASNAGKDELKTVAEDFSKKIQNVTIHLKEEKKPYSSSQGRRVYTTQLLFEFAYKDSEYDLEAAAVAVEPEITLYPSAPYAEPLVEGHTEIKSARERLDELEKVKDLISEVEYEEKRKAILSSI